MAVIGASAPLGDRVERTLSGVEVLASAPLGDRFEWTLSGVEVCASIGLC